MSIEYLERIGKPRLAFRRTPAAAPHLPQVIFCGGFRSDMEGTKAVFFEQRCTARGQGYVRFDYSGHGASAGVFEEGTIGGWFADVLDVFDALTMGKVVVAGSSMGGWLALLLARARPERVAGVVGIAAAPDFTRDIRDHEMDGAARTLLARQGYIDVPSAYSDEPYRITAQLITEGEAHCLLGGRIDIAVPVRLIHGMKDTDVPWQKAHRIRNATADPALCHVRLVETGDHRLARPEDLEILDAAVRELSGL